LSHMYDLIDDCVGAAQPKGITQLPPHDAVRALIEFVDPLDHISKKAAAGDATLFCEFPLLCALDNYLQSATDRLRGMGLPVSEALENARVAMLAKLHAVTARRPLPIYKKPVFNTSNTDDIEK
jgi:hypothetical protein